MRSAYLICLTLFIAPPAHAANAITKETLKIDRESRTYRGDTVIGPAWEFLKSKSKALAEDPHYQVYSYAK